MTRKLRLTILFLSFVVALVVSKIFLLTNNTLSNNGSWDSTKIGLEMHLMGAEEFFNGTQALENDQLNLGAWSGCQEVISRSRFDYDIFKSDVFFENGAYVIIHLRVDGGQKKSIKLSSKQSDNFCLQIDDGGKFLEKKKIEGLDLEPNRWYQVKIALLNEEAIIDFNGQKVSCQFGRLEDSKIGFRGSLAHTYVDNIVLQNGEKTVFSEDFSNKNELPKLVFWKGLFLSLIQLLLIKFLSKVFQGKRVKKRIIFILVSLNLSLIASLIAIYIYLFSHAGSYPNLESIMSRLRVKEAEWVDKELEIISDKVMTDYSDNSQPTIMFIGTSQTWGAGASKLQRTFPFLIEKELNEQLATSSSEGKYLNQLLEVSDDKKFKVINIGVSGSVSGALLRKYKEDWIELNPKLVLINLSNNDFQYGLSEDGFRSNLSQMIELNNENMIKTILIVEPRSVELTEENPFIHTLFELAETYQLPLIDLNQHVEEKNDSGLIWWDFIHFTDYGHQLAADYISNYLLELEN